MSLVVSTDGVPDREKLSHWNELVNRSFVPVAVTAWHKTPFSGRITTDHVGYLQVSTVEADPERVTRTARLISRSAGDSRDFISVGQQLTGTTVVMQDGREIRLCPGSLVVYDASRPYAFDRPDRFRMRVFQLPRTALGVPAAALRRVTASPVGTDTGVGALLVPFLTRLARTAAQSSPAIGDRLAGTAADLVAALITEQSGTELVDPDHAQRALVCRIRHYINENLGDTELSPEGIAAAHHISVRYLHKLFEREGATVGRWVQRRRLEECARELARGGQSAPTVSAVAQRWGFVNPAHFSRTFKAAYGATPREWRQQRTAMT
ncbi:AraC-like ligand-binding domain-containing protein [Streptomyces sp. NPDC054841]